MSRYKPFGKSKSQHGGGGFQFDKLLKVCSNSKKVAATANTIGSMGRFGITSFTSTRNTYLDSSGEDDNKLKSKSKRARLDLSKGGPVDPFGFPHDHPQNIAPPLTQENVNVGAVFKPRKFFKSRDPVQITTHGSLNNSQPPPLQPFVPPITIPIPTLTLSLHGSKKSNAGRKSKKKEALDSKPKNSRSNVSPVSRNSISASPPSQEIPAFSANSNHSSNNLVSPSIKLRIFKDKTTSKFVSVSDASPQKPVPQTEEKVPQRRGRKRKSDAEKLEKTNRKTKQNVPTPAPPPPPPGRTTRNSRKHQNPPNEINPMPVLSRGDAGLGLSTLSEMESMHVHSPNLTREVPLEEKRESSVDLVKKLEEEDSEFRQLSAMLSSMEEGEDTEQSRSHLEDSPPQSPPSPPPVPQIPKVNINSSMDLMPKPFDDPRSNIRDIRSMLEDEWDDEPYEEETTKKPSQSPNKVTRFDMTAAFGEDLSMSPERRKSLSKSPAPIQMEQKQIPEIPIVPQQPFNAPHAVRNLLSGFTDSPPIFNKVIETEMDIANIPRSHPVDPSLTQFVSTSRKGSIFKSRAAVPSNTEGNATNPKRLALYKHKFGQESGEIIPKKVPEPSTSYADFGDEDDGFEEAEDLSLRRLRGDGSGSPSDGNKVTCQRKSKRLFTVIKNVKPIHELQESGEVHEFDGDVWYILEDLKDKNPMTSRCLSAITLAMRCMEPAFRMHLRAHGTVAEFCKELHDAPRNPALALLAATVLFVLSQDRLNMDLDTESLQLIIALSKIEENSHLFDDNSEIVRHRQRVIDLVSEMQLKGHAEHLKIDKITAAELALETLLYLTSKRAGEWVKHELRTLGGLDYITTEVDKSLNYLKINISSTPDWAQSESILEKLRKTDRCLRVLQQVTFNHEDNQRYLLGIPHLSDSQSQGGQVATPSCSPAVFVNLFRFCCEHLPELSRESQTSAVMRELLFSVLRVLVNLTHDYRGIVLGSEILAAEPDLIQLTLHSVFNLSSIFLEDKVFDLLMHSLCMLLNLVEVSRKNREIILGMTVPTGVFTGDSNEQKSALDALIEMFFEKEKGAKTEEGHTDDILTKNSDGGKPKDTKDSQSSSDSQKNSQDKDSEGSSLQDIIDKLVQTAGRHMENSLIAAYISLLLAYLIMDDPVSTDYVRSAMPNSKFLPLMVFLKKLFNFMSITSSASGSIRGLKATTIALKFYAKHDPVSNEELKKVIPE